MVLKIFFLFFLHIGTTSLLKTDKINPYKFILKTNECEPNRVYQKNDITCFCNRYGRWPHRNCSLAFKHNSRATCKPNSFVQVNCNVCRCSKSGNIDKELCTTHICNREQKNRIIRRKFSAGKTKCDVNHWYEISSCRLCLCITKENLLCVAQSNPNDTQIGKYNLTDCGPNWLSDINNLLSSVNPLRLGSRIENQVIHIDEADATNAEKQVNLVEIKTTSENKIPNNNFKSIKFKQENNNIDKNLNIARIDLQNDDKSDDNDFDSSSESDSDERVQEGKAIARIAGNTAMPFENDEDNDSNDSNEQENKRIESDNDSTGNNKESADVGDATIEVESRVDVNKNKPENDQTEIDHNADKSILKLNLPGMLSKVFNFGIRKSMVSLDHADCTPGTTKIVECNTCFCLNNGKMLCTKKNC